MDDLFRDKFLSSGKVTKFSELAISKEPIVDNIPQNWHFQER